MARPHLLCLLALALGPALAQAETPVATVQWDALKAEGKLLNGEVLPGTPGGALRVVGGDEGPYNIPVWTVEAPPLSGQRWRVEGRVRHLNVEGEGNLLLLNFLSDDREYFTKTVAPAGPLGRLEGHSDWRPFVLPFDALGKGPPKKLTLQVFLSGQGSVDLADVVLYEGFDDALVADLGPRLGWNPATFGMAAGLLGGLVGLLGAIIGLLNASGARPGLVTLIRRSAIGLGGAAILVGLAALVTGAAGGWLVSVGVMTVAVMVGVGRAMERSPRARSDG